MLATFEQLGQLAVLCCIELVGGSCKVCRKEANRSTYGFRDEWGVTAAAQVDRASARAGGGGGGGGSSAVPYKKAQASEIYASIPF